jgi:hypothetical protein
MQLGPKRGCVKLTAKIGVWAVAILFVCSPCAWAKKPGGGGSGGGGSTSTGCSGKGGQTFNVTSFILDVDGAGNLFQLANDGSSEYYNYKNSRTDSVTSQILSASCNWSLSVTNSKSRTVELNLDYAVPGQSSVSLPSGWQEGAGLVNVPARIVTVCEANSANTGGQTYGLSVGNMTTAGETIQCGLRLKFYSGGNVYALSMNPHNWTGTTWAQVGCQSVGSDGFCDNWTVTPGPYVSGGDIYAQSPTGQTSAVGELVKPSCDGCSGGTPLGLYYVDFSARIQK